MAGTDRHCLNCHGADAAPTVHLFATCTQGNYLVRHYTSMYGILRVNLVADKLDINPKRISEVNEKRPPVGCVARITKGCKGLYKRILSGLTPHSLSPTSIFCGKQFFWMEDEHSKGGRVISGVFRLELR